ncbi:heme exporter protein CcmB [Pelagibacterales bacterium SAG-MED31]|nr:heme exporter protein CcmB [Pelagibacterales bacterium SAG-MED31]
MILIKMLFVKKIFLFFKRESKLFHNNIVDLLSNIIFFFLSIFVFVFALGTDEQLLRSIGLGIIWSLLLFSSTLSLRKFYEDDFNNGVLIIFHMSGISYEFIAFLKIISHFLFVQMPFLISLPIASIFFNLPIIEVYNLILTFIIGSLILSCLGSISASMNLLNKTNFSIGSILVLLFSIPLIIFSVGINEYENNFYSLFNLLLGIALIFLGISPWSSGAFIKLALKNK